MTNPDPVQVAYDVIEDVMTPAAYDSHHGGYWLSDLPPDLLAQRIVTALRDAGHLIPDHADRIDPDAWPAVAEGITVRAIRQALPDLLPSAPTVIARRIMADLTAAGLLLTETSVQAAAHAVLDEIEERLRSALTQHATDASGGSRPTTTGDQP